MANLTPPYFLQMNIWERSICFQFKEFAGVVSLFAVNNTLVSFISACTIKITKCKQYH